MRTLIYTIAYGQSAWNQAALMVRSLRGLGQYAGEIIVYTDRAKDQGEMAEASVKVESGALGLFSLKAAKAHIGKTLDCASYDRVLYMDSDVVAIDSLESLFQHAGTGLARDHQTVPMDGLYDLPGTRPIPSSGFNSGIIVANADRWNDLCQLWWKKMDEFWPVRPIGTWIDQPVLNHLINSGAISACPFPDGWVHLFLQGTAISRNTKCLHVTSPEKLAVMEACYSLANRV